MNRFSIPLPDYMKDLPLDNRGFPIPYVVLVTKDGIAHFKINDEKKVENAISNKLCNICGKPLGNDMWFIGGQLSAFHPKGAFNDSPVHQSCGHYAFKVCPYMAYTQYRKSNWHNTDSLNGLAFIDPTQTLVRLSFFVFAKAKGYKVTRRKLDRFLHPYKPYLEIEYWLDGQQLSQEQAKEILRRKGEYDYLPNLTIK